MNEIFSRVSTRSFLDKSVNIEDIKQVIKAGMQAPSAGNQQPWEFLIVNDKALLEELSKISKYATPIASAPAVIIVLAKSDEILTYPEIKSMDLSACTENILLEAVSLSLASVWIGVEPFEDRKKYIKDMFNLPDTVSAFSIVCLGYSKEEKEQKSRYDENRIHINDYKKA